MVGDPTLSRTVEYVFILADNVVPVALKSKEASDALGGSIGSTTEQVNRQNISYIKAVASLGAFRHGLRSMAMGMEELGLVNKETNASFFKLVAIADTFVGVALGVKGLIGIFQMLAKVEWGCAAVETYRKILQNPAWAAVAMGAAGLTTGLIAGYMWANMNQEPANGQGTTQITQNISFASGPDASARYASRSAMEGVY